MKTYIRNTKQELEALGFEYVPDEAEFGKDAYRHPYEPETVLKLWHQASQQACITIVRRAYEIAGLAHQGPKLPTAIKDRARIQKAQEKLANLRSEMDYQRRVNNVLQAENNERRRQELYDISQNLMGSGRPRCF